MRTLKLGNSKIPTPSRSLYRSVFALISGVYLGIMPANLLEGSESCRDLFKRIVSIATQSPIGRYFPGPASLFALETSVKALEESRNEITAKDVLKAASSLREFQTPWARNAEYAGHLLGIDISDLESRNYLIAIDRLRLWLQKNEPFTTEISTAIHDLFAPTYVEQEHIYQHPAFQYAIPQILPHLRRLPDHLQVARKTIVRLGQHLISATDTAETTATLFRNFFLSINDRDHASIFTPKIIIRSSEPHHGHSTHIKKRGRRKKTAPVSSKPEPELKQPATSILPDRAEPTADISTALDSLVANLPIASSIVREIISSLQPGTKPTIEDIYSAFKTRVTIFSNKMDELASDTPELSDSIWTVKDELKKRIDTLYTQFKKLQREQANEAILGSFAVECEVHFRGIIGEIAAVYFFKYQLFVQNIRFDYKGFRDKKLNRKARQFLGRIRSALKTKRDYYLHLPESSWATELDTLKRKFPNLIPPTFIAKSVGSWIGLFSMLANIEFDGFLRAAIQQPGDDQDYQALEVKALRNLEEREDAFLTVVKSLEKRKEFFEFLEMNIPVVLYLPYGCSPSQLQMLRSKNIQVHQGLPSSSEMVIIDIEITEPDEQ